MASRAYQTQVFLNMLRHIKNFAFIFPFLTFATSFNLLMGDIVLGQEQTVPNQNRPNILFIIAEGQTYPYYSMGDSTKFVNTPNFDRVAHHGILFTNAFVTAPQCAPSRASILTGQQLWQNGPAGAYFSTFPAGLTVYTDILKRHGYDVGYTGKEWGPGSEAVGGRETPVAGLRYENKKRNTQNIILRK